MSRTDPRDPAAPAQEGAVPRRAGDHPGTALVTPEMLQAAMDEAGSGWFPHAGSQEDRRWLMSQAIGAAEIARSSAPSGPAAPSVEAMAERPRTVEDLAQHLHDEEHEHDWTWPEHADDTGRREGGWVRITPKYIQAECREEAARIWRFLRLDRLAPNGQGKSADEWCFDMEAAPRDGSEVPLTDGTDVFSGFFSKVESRRSWADRNGNWFAEMDRGNETTAKPVTVIAWRPWFAPPTPAPEVPRG